MSGNDGDSTIFGIEYPALEFSVGLRYSTAVISFIKIDFVVRGKEYHLGNSETKLVEVDKFVLFSKRFKVPYYVGNEETQFIRFTIMDGDYLSLNKGYAICCVEVKITDILKRGSFFPLFPQQNVGSIFVFTELTKSEATLDLFGNDYLSSLGFNQIVPNENVIRSRQEYFFESFAFYTVTLYSKELIQVDGRKLQDLGYSNISMYIRFVVIDSGPDESRYIKTHGKEIWKSTRIEKAPFKLKIIGLNFSHEDLTGTSDINQAISNGAKLVSELVVIETKVNGSYDEFVVARCEFNLKKWIEGDSSWKDQQDWIAVDPDISNSFASAKLDPYQHSSIIQSSDDASRISNAVSNKRNTSFRDLALQSIRSKRDINTLPPFYTLIGNQATLGALSISVSRQLNRQKVISGDFFYERKLRRLLDRSKEAWKEEMANHFSSLAKGYHEVCKRSYCFLDLLISRGITFDIHIVADFHFPCMQNFLNTYHQYNSQTRDVKFKFETNEKSCRILQLLLLLYRILSPLTGSDTVNLDKNKFDENDPKLFNESKSLSETLDSQENASMIRRKEKLMMKSAIYSHRKIKVLAGGWITIPAKDDRSYIFLRNIAFPSCLEYQYMKNTDTIFEKVFCGFNLLLPITSYFNLLEESSTIKDEEEKQTGLDVSVDKDSSEEIKFSDLKERLRSWLDLVNKKCELQGTNYVQYMEYCSETQLIEGFMEATAAYYPLVQSSDAVQKSDRSKNAPAEPVGRPNVQGSQQRIACFTDTDYCQEFTPQAFSAVIPILKKQSLNACPFDIETLTYLIHSTAKSPSVINLNAWTLGRCPSSSELKKFKSLLKEHVDSKNKQSVLLVILASEHRYDFSDKDTEPLKVVADPFLSLINAYTDALLALTTTGTNNSSNQRRVKSTGLSYLNDKLRKIETDNRVTLLHFVSWGEVMAKSYLADFENNRVRRTSQSSSEDHPNNQLPTMLSLKETLESIFTVDATQRILQYNSNDNNESPDTLVSSSFDASDQDFKLPKKTKGQDYQDLKQQKSLKSLARQVTNGVKTTLFQKTEKKYESKLETTLVSNDEEKDELMNSFEIQDFKELNEIKQRFEKEIVALFNLQLKDALSKITTEIFSDSTNSSP